MLCSLDPWYCVPGVTQTPDSGLVYGGQGCLLVVLESSTSRRPHLALTFWDVAGDLICSFFPSRLPNTGVWIVSFCLHWWFDYCCCYYCFKFIYLCVYDVGGHMHVLIYMWRSRVALLSQFFSSTFTGGSGIKLSSSGLCAKCLYTMPWFLRL